MLPQTDTETFEEMRADTQTLQESVDSKQIRVKPELDIIQEIRDNLPEHTQAVKSVDMMQQVEAHKQPVQANLQAALDEAEGLTKNNEFEELTLTKELDLPDCQTGADSISR